MGIFIGLLFLLLSAAFNYAAYRMQQNECADCGIEHFAPGMRALSWITLFMGLVAFSAHFAHAEQVTDHHAGLGGRAEPSYQLTFKLCPKHRERSDLPAGDYSLSVPAKCRTMLMGGDDRAHPGTMFRKAQVKDAIETEFHLVHPGYLIFNPTEADWNAFKNQKN